MMSAGVGQLPGLRGCRRRCAVTSSSRQVAAEGRPSPPLRGPLVVLVLGILLSLGVAGVLHRARVRLHVARFDALVLERRAALQLRLETLVRAVEDTAAFFSASESVTPEEFETFARQIVAEDAALVALSWNPVVERDRTGPTSVLVRYIEPEGGNAAALRFDVAGEPRRRAALVAAAVTGRPIATAPLTLVQSQDAGLLIFAPVYSKERPATPEGRLAAVQGYAVGVLRMDALLEDALGRFQRNPFALEVVDVDALDERIVYRSDAVAPADAHTRTASLSWGGRRWQLSAQATELDTPGIGPELGLAGGLLITLLLAAYLRVQQERRRSMERHAAELQQANTELAREMAERVRAEQDKRNLQAKVMEAQRLESLGALSGGLAHDINNLLVGIIGSADYALQMLEPPPEVRAELEGIVAAGQRVAGITEAMLAYAGRGYYAPEGTDLASIVHDALAELQPLKAGVEFRNSLEQAPLSGDVKLLRQAVLNLLTNALEAVEGSGELHVRTGTASQVEGPVVTPMANDSLPPGPYAFFEVRDTGCGMAPEVRERMFEPFFSTKFQGRGLGLAAVLGIVRRGRGTISVSSTPGEGTTVRIYLPAAASARPALAPGPVPTPAPSPAPAPADGVRALVVDDEGDVRNVLRRILERDGLHVVEAVDGADCLRLMGEGEPVQVILMDVSMSGLSGPSTLLELRKRGHRVPVILMSGYAKEDVLAMVGDDGLQSFLHKPFRPADVMARVREAVAQP
jgi:signal transduction histidine kinase